MMIPHRFDRLLWHTVTESVRGGKRLGFQREESPDNYERVLDHDDATKMDNAHWGL